MTFKFRPEVFRIANEYTNSKYRDRSNKVPNVTRFKSILKT